MELSNCAICQISKTEQITPPRNFIQCEKCKLLCHEECYYFEEQSYDLKTLLFPTINSPPFNDLSLTDEPRLFLCDFCKLPSGLSNLSCLICEDKLSMYSNKSFPCRRLQGGNAYSNEDRKLIPVSFIHHQCAFINHTCWMIPRILYPNGTISAPKIQYLKLNTLIQYSFYIDNNNTFKSVNDILTNRGTTEKKKCNHVLCSQTNKENLGFLIKCQYGSCRNFYHLSCFKEHRKSIRTNLNELSVKTYHTLIKHKKSRKFQNSLVTNSPVLFLCSNHSIGDLHRNGNRQNIVKNTIINDTGQLKKVVKNLKEGMTTIINKIYNQYCVEAISFEKKKSIENNASVISNDNVKFLSHFFTISEPPFYLINGEIVYVPNTDILFLIEHLFSYTTIDYIDDTLDRSASECVIESCDSSKKSLVNCVFCPKSICVSHFEISDIQPILHRYFMLCQSCLINLLFVNRFNFAVDNVIKQFDGFKKVADSIFEASYSVLFENIMESCPNHLIIHITTSLVTRYSRVENDSSTESIEDEEEDDPSWPSWAWSPEIVQVYANLTRNKYEWRNVSNVLSSGYDDDGPWLFVEYEWNSNSWNESFRQDSVRHRLTQVTVLDEMQRNASRSNKTSKEKEVIEKIKKKKKKTKLKESLQEYKTTYHSNGKPKIEDKKRQDPVAPSDITNISITDSVSKKSLKHHHSKSNINRNIVDEASVENAAVILTNRLNQGLLKIGDREILSACDPVKFGLELSKKLTERFKNSKELWRYHITAFSKALCTNEDLVQSIYDGETSADLLSKFDIADLASTELKRKRADEQDKFFRTQVILTDDLDEERRTSHVKLKKTTIDDVEITDLVSEESPIKESTLDSSSNIHEVSTKGGVSMSTINIDTTVDMIQNLTKSIDEQQVTNLVSESSSEDSFINKSSFDYFKALKCLIISKDGLYKITLNNDDFDNLTMRAVVFYVNSATMAHRRQIGLITDFSKEDDIVEVYTLTDSGEEVSVDISAQKDVVNNNDMSLLDLDIRNFLSKLSEDSDVYEEIQTRYEAWSEL